MKPSPDSVPQMQFLLPDLATILDARQPLHRLARRIDWAQFETAFGSLYEDEGRPGLPIRRMVGLLLLKQLHNLSDEPVVEQWTLNPYFQFFCGEQEFQWSTPCAASELVHFRHRIGPGGAEKLLALPIAVHGDQAKEKEVVLDTTAQEKAIIFPTDAKLCGKVIKTARRIAAKNEVALRQSYARTVPQLLQAQRGWRHPRTQPQARKAARKLKTIAGPARARTGAQAARRSSPPSTAHAVPAGARAKTLRRKQSLLPARTPRLLSGQGQGAQGI